jgi:hypothetical protein
MKKIKYLVVLIVFLLLLLFSQNSVKAFEYTSEERVEIEVIKNKL